MKITDRACTALLITFGPAAAGLLPAEAQGGGLGIGITPRAAAYFDNSTQQDTGVDEQFAEQASTSFEAIEQALQTDLGPTAQITGLDFDIAIRSGGQAYFPMVGGSLTFGWPGSEDTQITATALVGEAEFTSKQVFKQVFQLDYDGLTSQDIYVTDQDTVSRLERTDVELTIQHRLDETFALVGGFRYESVDQEFDFAGSLTSTNNSANLLAQSFGVTDAFLLDLTLGGATSVGAGSATIDTYSVRFGGAAYAQFGDNQRAYVNGLLHVAHTPETVTTSTSVITSGSTVQTVNGEVALRSSTAIGPDLTVGYQILFTERIALDFRYRGQFYYTVDGTSDFNDPRVNHGISVGLSAWF